MKIGAFYPTDVHARAATAIADHFAAGPEVEAVLLVNSCTRGKASRDSCLDVVVLVPTLKTGGQEAAWWAEWQRFYREEPLFRQLEGVGRFSGTHLDFIEGIFAPPSDRDETGGPDMFEIEIGNFLAYSFPLYERGDLYQRLKAQWLPYYGEDLRRERLAMVRGYCLHNLEHVPLYVGRGLYFQAFNRLYDALHEFLQALFIARRTYPIAYDKWIHEQIVEILGLPALYRELVSLLEVCHLEGDELVHKAARLRGLLDDYATA